MKKTMVVYHRADFDGIFCREIARKFLPEAELIGWDFGDKPIEVPSRSQIYVLDLPLDAPFGFSYAKVGNERGPQHPAGVVWIDHHKSSIESHPTDIPGYRIDGVAACRLTWQWFTNTSISETGKHSPQREAFVERLVIEPLAVTLAGEYDIWDKRDPNAELFQHGLRSQDLNGWWEAMLSDEATASVAEIENRLEQGSKFELLPNGNIKVPGLGERVVNRLLRRGEAIQYAKTQENESTIKDIGFDLAWEGLQFLACNAARYNSHLFTAGLQPEHDACFGFKWTGKDWSVSLYHAPGKEHHDLSQIAKKYGGGGHRGACGFRAAKLPFLP